jgi:hypothetical protein
VYRTAEIRRALAGSVPTAGPDSDPIPCYASLLCYKKTVALPCLLNFCQLCSCIRLRSELQGLSYRRGTNATGNPLKWIFYIKFRALHSCIGNPVMTLVHRLVWKPFHVVTVTLSMWNSACWWNPFSWLGNVTALTFSPIFHSTEWQAFGVSFRVCVFRYAVITRVGPQRRTAFRICSSVFLEDAHSVW